MSDMSLVQTEELRSRMEFVLSRLDVVFGKIGPHLKELGDLQQEAHLVYGELMKRGVVISEPPEQQKDERRA